MHGQWPKEHGLRVPHCTRLCTEGPLQSDESMALGITIWARKDVCEPREFFPEPHEAVSVSLGSRQRSTYVLGQGIVWS